MLAKRLFQKAAARHRHNQQQRSPENAGSCLASSDVDLRVILHYGVPSTASILAFDPIQHLLAIGTLDGWIKVIGGDNVEYLFISPEKLPYKYLEFIHNEGYLTSITTDNSIEVWDLKRRCKACSLHWESNITAFSIVSGSNFMYVGDEYGVVSVVQYDAEKVELLHLPYQISSETAGFPLLVHQPVVGVLPQPCSSGTRLLIAYECGLLILWDVYKAQIVVVRGDKVLQLKNNVDSLTCVGSTLIGNVSPQLEEKEISAACWASSDGSVLAVGYVDGDILLWKTCLPGKNQQSGLSEKVVKLQLSPAEKRLPVIVLHWWANHKSHRDGDGQLLIYGGDEIGCDEVLTVLNLEWSSGMETVQCLNRVEVSLSGSFADVAITSGTMGSDKNISLFILTNPGRLQIFDVASLCASVPKREKKMSVSPVDFPPVISTINPLITVASLFCFPTNGDLSKGLAEVDLFKKFSLKHKMSEGKRWPLTGGVCNHLSSDKDHQILRLYIAGYQDGSVQMWDATYPVLSFLCKLESEIRGVNVAISVTSVSKLEFCIHTFRLAVGYECGLVRIYDLISSDERSFHFVTESTHEVKPLADDELNCRAAFSFFKSQVQALKFTNSGAKLATGYSCGRIVVLDMNTFSAMFVTDTISSPISIYDIILDGLANDSKKYGSKDANDQCKNLMFIFTKDGAICIIDADIGNLISSQPMHLSKDTTAVSMHVLDGSTRGPRALSQRQKQQLSKDETIGSQPAQDTMTNVDNKSEPENQSLDNESTGQHLDELFLLLCFKDIIRVYAAKSIVQGDKKTICKLRLTKPCCWTTTFMKDGILCGLLLLYDTGDWEIRSLPNLELVKENSLTSVLRWNFNANVERTMTSTNNGHIALVNGSELAFLSIVSNENGFRIPESLPDLHDEVLAAAAKAAISYSLKHKKKQGGSGGIFHGIVKGFKREKLNLPWDLACSSESLSSHLEDIFMRDSTLDPSAMSNDAELNIDDVEIDEPVNLETTSSHGVQRKTDNKKDREKFFNDEASGIKPKLRTREEILATYRQAGDASSVAGEARNKLLERQEKLKRIGKQSEELRSEAEDFASLANELLKVMENRKWWHI